MTSNTLKNKLIYKRLNITGGAAQHSKDFEAWRH